MNTPIWLATSLLAAGFAVSDEPKSAPPAKGSKLQTTALVEEFRRRLAEFRTERAGLARERKDVTADAAKVDAMPPVERTELQKKISEALTRLATSLPAKPTAVDSPPGKSSSPELPADFKPADPIALARALFRNQEHESALRILRLVEVENLEREDRAFVRYLMASCLRHMGKWSEALVIYRDVADQRDDPFLSDCSLWQIASIKWQQEAQTQLEQSRRIR